MTFTAVAMPQKVPATNIIARLLAKAYMIFSAMEKQPAATNSLGMLTRRQKRLINSIAATCTKEP